MANKISTKPLSGMRDFLPIDIARRQYVVGIVREVYERYGFVPLETPALESVEILLGKYGEGEKLIYRVLRRGEALGRVMQSAGEQPLTTDALSDEALRYDLTVPLARVVAQYGDLPKYFKRYQIQPVWRADRPGKGRFREFYQCDVDITGTKSPMAEAEVCGAGCEVLQRLGFENYELQVNHRRLLRSMIRSAGIDLALESTTLIAVDKIDKIGADGVREELAARGIDPSAVDRLLAILDLGGSGSNAEVLSNLREALDDEGRQAVDELTVLLELFAVTAAGKRARIAPKLARGLGYYTGPIFEMVAADLAGSIAGGGRYDELVGVFGKQPVPAVGLSLGLERILVVMADRGLYPDLHTGPELLLCWKDVAASRVLAIAHALRAQGVRVEVFPEAQKLGKQVQYADSPGVKAAWVGIVGDEELASGEITLKHLASGDQTRVPLAGAGAHIASRPKSPAGL